MKKIELLCLFDPNKIDENHFEGIFGLILTPFGIYFGSFAFIDFPLEKLFFFKS